MKKAICLLITAVLILSSTSLAFAKTDKGNMQAKVSFIGKHEEKQLEKKLKEEEKKLEKKLKEEEKKLEKKLKEEEKKKKDIKKDKKKDSKKPVDPKKGKGATVTYDEKTAVLTVTNADNIIVINFNKETVTLNGILIIEPMIFKQLNISNTNVLVQYIVALFGEADLDNEKDKVKFDSPKNVTVSIVGPTMKTNTINASSLYVTAAADIKAGQATGGRAELYVGSRFIAADLNIAATDTAVTFTTSDNSPTNYELKTLIPEGGEVIVKLYSADNKLVSESKKNPKLIVDYVAPAITGVSTAIYNVKDKELYIIVNNAEKVGDKVDVTKLTLYDTTLGRVYQLTADSKTGSKGVVNSANALTIDLGSIDRAGLSGYVDSNVVLTIGSGALLYDEAGNVSAGLTNVATIPVVIIK